MFKYTTALAMILTAGLFALPAWAQEDERALPGVGVNYEMRLSTIEDQMRAITGKLEQTEYTVRRMDQTLQRLQADLDMRLTKLESAPAPQPVAQAPQPHAKQDAESVTVNAVPEQAPTGQLGDLKLRDGKVAGATHNPKATPLPEKPDDYGLNAQEMYDRAFGLLRQASYDDAEKAFSRFIEKYPQDKLIENAKYWHAETFYVRGKFNEATVAFADAYQQNAKGPKAPDSLLKMGMALASLGKKDDACATFASLKKNFPSSASTLRARADQERARLKCK